MLPHRLTADQPEAERRRWRIVRLDTHVMLGGLILEADCDSGACTMHVRRGDQVEVESLNFGPGGIAIVGR
jgi:hypothetical protein